MVDREVHKKRIGLDNHWKYKRTNIACPFCCKKGLWEDTHELKDANYYCSRCNMPLLIVPNYRKRLIHMEE